MCVLSSDFNDTDEKLFSAACSRCAVDVVKEFLQRGANRKLLVRLVSLRLCAHNPRHSGVSLLFVFVFGTQCTPRHLLSALYWTRGQQDDDKKVRSPRLAALPIATRSLK